MPIFPKLKIYFDNGMKRTMTVSELTLILSPTLTLILRISNYQMVIITGHYSWDAALHIRHLRKIITVVHWLITIVLMPLLFKKKASTHTTLVSIRCIVT